jgi:hypothetical protein
MTSPAVSVVIPTYERRDMVRRAVASVLSQTFQNFELIVVDDGSTDGTGPALAGPDERIRYEWQDNRGLAAARNVGIRLARGEIVAFLDSDDRWLPHHLAVVAEVLSHHPAVVLCATSPRFHIGGRQPASAAEVVDALPSLFAENLVGHVSAVAVRREPILAVGGFDERLRVMEAWELWRRLAVLGPFALLRRRTIVYQTTRGSLSQRGGRTGEYDSALGIVADSAVTVAAGARRPDGPDLRIRAAGLVAYFEALRALSREDEAAARIALSDACLTLPELSSEPQLVANRLSLLRFGSAGRLRAFGSAAMLWPDPRADTALYLRMHALALALRLGRVSEAVRLLRSWPIVATPRFLAHSMPLFARLLRHSLEKLLYRGRESRRIATTAPPQRMMALPRKGGDPDLSESDSTGSGGARP